MTKYDLNTRSVQATETASDAEQTAAAYRRPLLVVAGSTVELVEGCYCPYAYDTSGYYTYGNAM